MSGKHWPIAPSSLALTVACHASLKLGEPYQNLPDTPEQLEGTAAHWVNTQELVPALGAATPQGMPVTEDMLYGRLLWERATGLYGNVETPVQITRIHPTMCGGTPDWWDYQPIAQLLRVLDYKFGHLFVDVFECWQLIAYVLGVAEFLELPEDTWVEMGIVQPRSYHAEGPVRFWGGVGKLRLVDLRGYANRARYSAEMALKSDPKATVGPHCLLCPARHECRTLENAAMAVCDFVGTIERVDLPAPALAAELAILEDASVLLEARLTGLQEQAMARIRRGERLLGFGIDHVKSRAVWNKPMSEVYEMGDLMDVDLRAEPAAITPAQAIKKGIDAMIIEGYSFRPPGAAKLIKDTSTAARKVFGANAT